MAIGRNPNQLPVFFNDGARLARTGGAVFPSCLRLMLYAEPRGGLERTNIAALRREFVNVDAEVMAATLAPGARRIRNARTTDPGDVRSLAGAGDSEPACNLQRFV